jgi:hypothetical protein
MRSNKFRYNFYAEIISMNRLSHKNAVYLQSEALKMVNYDAAKQVLEATFNGDRIYQYENVSEKVWENFLDIIQKGESAGAFINQHIKPFYKCDEVT